MCQSLKNLAWIDFGNVDPTLSNPNSWIYIWFFKTYQTTHSIHDTDET